MRAGVMIAMLGLAGCGHDQVAERPRERPREQPRAAPEQQAEHIAPAQPPAGHPMLDAASDEDPQPTPTLATASTLYALEIEGTAPRCRKWTVHPTTYQLVREHDGSTATFESVGDELRLCDGSLNYVVEHEGWLEVSGARLFRTADGCAAAIANRERVALRIACESSEPDMTGRSQRRFSDTVVRGGTLYVIESFGTYEKCTAARFPPAQRDGDQWSGMWRNRFVEAGEWGTRYRSFLLSSDFTAIDVVEEAPLFDNDDTNIYGGILCGEEPSKVLYERDRVVAREEFFFTRESCNAEHAHRRAWQRWMPVEPANAPNDVPNDVPLAGGC